MSDKNKKYVETSDFSSAGFILFCDIDRMLEEIHIEIIREALKATHGNISFAARLLNLDRTTLWTRIRRFKIDVSEYFQTKPDIREAAKDE